MSWKNALVDYAENTSPQELPKDVYLTHTKQTLTIFDKFPKATFHFLTLPRMPFELQEQMATYEVPKHTLNNLAALVGSKYGLAVLRILKEASREVIDIIEEEMVKREGFKWPISVGFHAIESMAQVHLHVISQDFISDSLKNKKHWNSFNPKHGFFLHLDDVLDWVEHKTLKEHNRPKSGYEKLLTEPLQCYDCDETFATIPKLKEHLRADFEKRKSEHGGKGSRKRTASPPAESSQTKPLSHQGKKARLGQVQAKEG